MAEDTTDGSNEGNATTGDASTGAASFTAKTTSIFLRPFTFFNLSQRSHAFQLLLAKIKKFLNTIIHDSVLKNEIPRLAFLFLMRNNSEDLAAMLSAGRNGEVALLHRVYKFLQESYAIKNPALKNALMNCVLTAFAELEKDEVMKLTRELILRPGEFVSSRINDQLVLEAVWQKWREKLLAQEPVWFVVNNPLLTEEKKQFHIFQAAAKVATEKFDLNLTQMGAIDAKRLSLAACLAESEAQLSKFSAPKLVK